MKILKTLFLYISFCFCLPAYGIAQQDFGIVHLQIGLVADVDSMRASSLRDFVHVVMQQTFCSYTTYTGSYTHLQEAMDRGTIDVIFGCPRPDSLHVRHLFSIPYESFDSASKMYTASTRLGDYNLMTAINSAIINMHEQKIVHRLKRHWLGEKGYITKFSQVQLYYRIALIFCVVFIIACVCVVARFIMHTFRTQSKRNQMRRLLSKMPIPLYILKKKGDDLHYEYINNSAKIPPFSLRKKCDSSQEKTHKVRLKEAYSEALSTGKSVTFIDRRLPESPFNVYVSSCTFNGEQAVVETIVNMYELLLLKEKAEENARNIDEFLASISHEVRTPLNAILGFTQMLPELTVEERQEALSIVEVKSKQLQKLVDDILLLAKLESGDMVAQNSSFTFGPWIADVIQELSLQKGENPAVRIVVDSPPTEDMLRSDTNLLHIMFSNLLQNALKFTSTGIVHVGYALIGHHTVYYVQDTGIGMNVDDSTRIFNRFVKINTFTQGTGLGMPIVLAVCNVIQAHVGVYSEENVGTTFYVSCPCHFVSSHTVSHYPSLVHLPHAQWINGTPSFMNQNHHTV